MTIHSSGTANVQSSGGGAPAHHTPARERMLLWLLAFAQFSVITDFMVMMPLGPQIMQAFGIGPTAFATAVSVHSWGAGLSGFFAATYIDRFDRKRLLLTVFALFALSNLGCAFAPNFSTLLFARAFAGLTAGVLTSVVMAIVADVIPVQRRGAAMGTVMTSFAMAAVAGVPLGVVLGAYFGWQAPFVLLNALSILIWLSAARIVPHLRAHLAKGAAPLRRVLPELFLLVGRPRHLNAFIMTGLVTTSGMMIIPFIAPMLVANQGVQPAELSWIYMAGGLATLYTARALGRLSDRYGKQRIFRCVAVLATAPMLFMTHLPPLPLLAIIALFPVFMVLVSGRAVPLQALQTTVPEPAQRGAFLSVNAAMQSLGTGVGAWAGGLMVSVDASGRLIGFGLNGWAGAGLTLFSILWIARIRSAPVSARVSQTASGARVS